MQSNEHTLPSAGNRLMPRETPSRRLCTGPNIGDGYIIVLMFTFVDKLIYLQAKVLKKTIRRRLILVKSVVFSRFFCYFASILVYYTLDIMGKRCKKARNHRGLQMITLCISTTMVLILLGMVVFSVLTARNLTTYVKENLTVTIMLTDDVDSVAAKKISSTLYGRGYAHSIEYISKELAKKEQTEAMGSDPSEFLGFNPFTPTLEVRMKADYANGDSLKWISAEIKKMARVTDVAYQEDLMDKVNDNLQKLNIVLIALALLLMCVSYSLISNTVRLSVYSRRFLIHSMKLVGASWGFIRRPFVKNALIVGLLASLFACLILGGGVYALYSYEPNILMIISWDELAITAAAVFFFGIAITLLCSYISVNKFLKMSAGELYKI